MSEGKSVVERTRIGLAAVEQRRAASIAAAARLQFKIELLTSVASTETVDDLLAFQERGHPARNDDSILAALAKLSDDVRELTSRIGSIESRPQSGETVLFGGIDAGLPEDGDGFEAIPAVQPEDFDIPSFLRDAAAFGSGAPVASPQVIRMLADLDTIDQTEETESHSPSGDIPDEAVETENQVLARHGIEIPDLAGVDHVDLLGVKVPVSGIDKIVSVVRDAEASIAVGVTAEEPTKGPYRNAKWRRQLWRAIVARTRSADADPAAILQEETAAPKAVAEEQAIGVETAEAAALEEAEPIVAPQLQGMRRLQDLDESAAGFLRDAQQIPLNPVVPDANGDLPTALPVSDLPKPPEIQELREVVVDILKTRFPQGALLAQIRDAVGQRFDTAGKKPMFWWLMLCEGPFEMDSETSMWAPIEA